MSEFERKYNRPPASPPPPDKRFPTGMILLLGTLMEVLALFSNMPPEGKVILFLVGLGLYASAVGYYFSSAS